jgi:hypothetical protein
MNVTMHPQYNNNKINKYINNEIERKENLCGSWVPASSLCGMLRGYKGSWLNIRQVRNF